jgi:uncharacterized protein YcbK (DUF882 family)
MNKHMTNSKEALVDSRRKFLRASVQVGIGLILASPLDLLATQLPQPETLSFYHNHTRESFDLCQVSGTCPPTIQQGFNSFLRDFRTGEVHPIDFRLVHILQQIQKIAGSSGVFHVISGYRSPKTNKALRARSTGVAKRSMHMRGKAIDIRLTDLPTCDLRDIAISLKAGGVGYYAESDFVHVDTGRFRTW